MARMKDGRLLPTFFLASPMMENMPSLGKAIRILSQQQWRIARYEDSLSRQSRYHCDSFTTVSEVSKNLYDEFDKCTDLECGKSAIVDQPHDGMNSTNDPFLEHSITSLSLHHSGKECDEQNDLGILEGWAKKTIITDLKEDLTHQGGFKEPAAALF